jgi:hypothetical protein
MHAKWTLAALLAAWLGGAGMAQAQSLQFLPGTGDLQIVPINSLLQPAAACEAPSCTDMSCTMPVPPACGYDQPCGDYCCQGYCNRFSVFGEFLYLRARGAEVAYGVEADGEVLDDVGLINQIAPVQVVDQDYQPGFRAGGSWVLDECSMVQVTYSQLDSNESDSYNVNNTGDSVFVSLVEPLSVNAVSDDLQGFADQTIQFKMIDADYKGLIAYCNDYRVAYIAGVRYAELEQDFNAIFEVNGVSGAFSHIDFYGAGLRLGLEGERFCRNPQLFVYGRGVMNLLGGEFKADYVAGDQGQGIVDTSWEAARLVTIADLELGVGWQNYCGNLRLSAGYMYSMWYNVVKTQEWINAVQRNNFVDPSDNFNGFMSFDGLTAKIEYLW